MKRGLHIFMVATIVCFTNAFGQLNYAVDWVKQINTEGGASSGVDVKTDKYGNVYSTGYFTGTIDLDPGSATQTVASNGGYDFYIVKQDQNGDFIWGKSIGGIGDDWTNAVEVDSSGNVFITGRFESVISLPLAGGGSISYNAGPDPDAFLIKFDQNGVRKWFKQIKAVKFNGRSVGTDLSIDAEQNVIMIGTFKGVVDFRPGMGIFVRSSIIENTFVTKYSNVGVYKWTKTSKSNGYVISTATTADSLGNIYVSGYCTDTTYFLYNSTTTGVVEPVPTYQLWFMAKYSKNGNLSWVKSFAGSSGYVEDLIYDQKDGLLFCGSLMGCQDFDPSSAIDSICVNTSNNNGFIAKWDTSGTHKWVKPLRSVGSGKCYVNALDIDDEGRIVSIGTIRATVDFDPGPGSHIQSSTASAGGSLSNFDFFLLWLDSTGGFESVELYGNIYDDFGLGIDVNADSIYTTGHFLGTIDFNPFGIPYFVNANSTSSTTQPWQAFVYKIHNIDINNQFKGIQASNEDEFIVAPNPFTNEFYVKSPEGEYEMNVYSTSGKLVMTKNLHNQFENVDVMHLQTGMYVAVLVDKNTNLQVKTVKLIKE